MAKTTAEKLKDFENLKHIRIRNLSRHHFDEDVWYTINGRRRREKIEIKPRIVGMDHPMFNAEHARETMRVLSPFIERGLLKITYINREPTYEHKRVMAMYTQPSHPRYVPPTDPRSPFYEESTSKKRTNNDR